MSLTANAALNDTTQIKEIASCARHPRRMQPLVGAGVPDFTYFTRSVGGVSPLFIVRCEGLILTIFNRHIGLKVGADFGDGLDCDFG